MEIAVYTYKRNTFINEDSPIYKASGYETVEYEEMSIAIPSEVEISTKLVLKYDEDSKTSLKELYALGYRLIQKENNFFYLEKE